MNEYNENASIFFVICALFVFSVGFSMGFVMGTLSAREETEQGTIIKCMENQKECKVKYDFYQLSNVK